MAIANTIKSRLFKAMALACFALFLFVARPAVAVEYIYNHSLQEQRLSKLSLRAIFTSRMRRWPDGTQVTLVTYSYDNPVFIDVCSRMNVYPINFKRIWDMVIYSGGGKGPIFVDDEDEMLRVVKSTPGAIGYIQTVNEGDEIHVLQID